MKRKDSYVLNWDRAQYLRQLAHVFRTLSYLYLITKRLVNISILTCLRNISKISHHSKSFKSTVCLELAKKHNATLQTPQNTFCLNRSNGAKCIGQFQLIWQVNLYQRTQTQGQNSHKSHSKFESYGRLHCSIIIYGPFKKN